MFAFVPKQLERFAWYVQSILVLPGTVLSTNANSLSNYVIDSRCFVHLVSLDLHVFVCWSLSLVDSDLVSRSLDGAWAFSVRSILFCAYISWD